ncbi:MAG TPA: hypothetical protein VFR81_28105 [Longimicrobium sp.]|nr:hypothetical protein [Longimicrobium sp.]
MTRISSRPGARRWLWAANAAVFLAMGPLMAHGLLQRVQFNQFALQRMGLSYRTASAEMLADALRSAYGSGVHLLLDRPDGRVPAWTDTLGVFRYVFTHVPPHAVVYPSEGIYYFNARLGERRISGNIRVADLDRGELTFAYFDQRTQETIWTTVGSRQGLKVSKGSDYRYRVEFAGHEVGFELEEPSRVPPRSVGMVPQEELVANVHDESGLRFALLFNRETESFYYVLDEDRGVTDRLVPVGREYLLGRRTHFLFFADAASGRKLLVGISGRNTARNTWLDGPPDQVPFRAAIRDRLHRAYPATRLGPEIDDTGVRRGSGTWSRMVIAPLRLYASVPAAVDELERARVDGHGPSVLWTSLTREYWNTPDRLAEAERMLVEAGKPFVAPRWFTLIAEGAIPDRSAEPAPPPPPSTIAGLLRPAGASPPR